MDAARRTRIREIFADAGELPSEQRARFLDQACDGDLVIREQVDSLLAASCRAAGFMAAPTINVPSDSSAPVPFDARLTEPDRPPRDARIGPYRPLRRIGEGGFGEVWLAEQHEPRRHVALKIIKAGMDSTEVLARFEAERQALALMDHPNVAKVFDAGQTDPHSPIGPGRPYFVMEHAAGSPITDYCDANRLRIRQRLELFVTVAQAIQHAHTKGIIHRDLKPSNILITLSDGKPTPKVIDFGIAKATAAPLTDRTLHTQAGRLLGTPAYMSPEQAGSGGIDVDTRSDVYSLGVILYQLLTGTLPFDPRALCAADYAGLIRIIREQEPPRPSTRLSTLGDESVNPRHGATSQDVAAQRDVDFAALRRQVRGELDWIVMKCLEKDRTRRYETANSLALDVKRHLAGEPIAAAPPGALYRLSKTLHRHRTAAGVGVGFIVLIAAALTATSALWRRAAHARDAESEQRARAEAVSVFLKDMLTAADPTKTKGARLTVRDALDQAAAVIDDGALRAQPQVEAELRATIGETYFALGLYPQSQAQLEAAEAVQARAWGDDDSRVLRTRSQLARCYAWAGDHERAVALARPTLARLQRVLGADHPETLRTLSFLGNAIMLTMSDFAESESCLRQALAAQQRTLGPQHEDTIETKLYLSWLISTDSTESVPLAQEALDSATAALGPDHPHALLAMNLLGTAYRCSRNYTEAEAWQRRAYEATVRVFGEEHLRTADCLAELGTTLNLQQRYDEAAAVQIRAVEIARRTYGPGRKWSIRYQQDQGVNLNDARRYAEAELVLGEAVAQARAMLGPEDFETLNTQCQYVTALVGLDRIDEAVAISRQVLATSTRVFGTAARWTRDFRRRHAGILWRAGRRDEAETLIYENIEACRRAFGPHDRQTIRELNRCAEFLRDRDQRKAAEPLAREAAAGYRRLDPKFRPGVGNAVYMLATIVNRLGPPEEALELALEAAGDPDANANHLNHAAWALLNTSVPERRDPARALEFSLRANELGRFENVTHLETLAVAHHRVGDSPRAVEVLDQALALLAADPRPSAGDLHRLALQLLRLPTEIRHDPELGLQLAIRAARSPDASASHMNFAAWELLTTATMELRDPALALELAQKANELSQYENPAQLDTLSLAFHRTGDTTRAIEVQQRALALLPADAPDRAEYEDRLREFQAASGGIADTP